MAEHDMLEELKRDEFREMAEALKQRGGAGRLAMDAQQDRMNRSWSGIPTRSGRAHVCNCIGCCEKCGGCLTTPWHARACERLAELNAERERVVAEAMES